MDMKKLVVIGSGMACGRFLEDLLKQAPESYQITVIGEEPHPNYNRIMLSPLLANEVGFADIILNSQSWYQKHGIELIKGDKVTRIDSQNNQVLTAQGMSVSYDELVIATGSRPARIPAEGQELENIFDFRTISDVEEIQQRTKTAKTAVVIGGGLLGLEAAYGLAIQGLEVTVVHRSGHLLNRQLDKAAGQMLASVLATKNIQFQLATEVECFNPSAETPDNVGSCSLTNGINLSADIVVIATGITPNKEVAEDSGIECNRGILVNDYLQTDTLNISAIGECIEHKGETFGLVAPIWDQTLILARRLANKIPEAYVTKPSPTKLKISGVDLLSAGEVNEQEGDRTLIVKDEHSNIYRKLIIRAQKIVGIVLFGNVQDGNWYFDLLENNTDTAQYLPNLIFGKALTGAEK